MKLRRQAAPPSVSAPYLLHDVIGSDVIAGDTVTNLCDDNDDDDVDERFRDAVYRSVKRSTLRSPPLRCLLDRRTSADARAEAVVYRPTTAPDTAGCVLCGDAMMTRWTVDDRPDLIDVGHRTQQRHLTVAHTR